MNQNTDTGLDDTNITTSYNEIHKTFKNKSNWRPNPPNKTLDTFKRAFTSRFTQNDLLEVRTKDPITTLVMTTKYHPRNPDIKGFIHDNWNIIQHSNDCANTFPDKPIIGFKRLPNLRDLLTNATISYPPNNMEPKKPIPTHCTRLGKCKYCPIISRNNEITCKISGDKYQPKNLPKSISCELSDIVYLIACKKM